MVQSRPPWFSTSDRLIDKPIPMPFALVVKKGVKTRSASDPRPVPESRTATSMSPDSSTRDSTQSKRGRSITADHGFDAIHDQVQQDLLHLNPIS